MKELAKLDASKSRQIAIVNSEVTRAKLRDLCEELREWLKRHKRSGGIGRERWFLPCEFEERSLFATLKASPKSTLPRRKKIRSRETPVEGRYAKGYRFSQRKLCSERMGRSDTIIERSKTRRDLSPTPMATKTLVEPPPLSLSPLCALLWRKRQPPAYLSQEASLGAAVETFPAKRPSVKLVARILETFQKQLCLREAAYLTETIAH